MWVVASPDAFRVEIQAAEMEVNRSLESFLIAEPSTTHLDRFDLAVGALGMAVVAIQNHRVGNAPQVLLDHPRHLLDRIQSAAYHPAIPSLPALLSPGPADVVPQRHGGRPPLSSGPRHHHLVDRSETRDAMATTPTDEAAARYSNDCFHWVG